MTSAEREVSTPQGPGRLYVDRPPPGVPRRGSLVLSHGAGGGVQAADLVALRALTADGWTYVRVDQPWRVAGRRIAGRPPTLDAAWVPIVASLTTGRWALPRPLIVGGRSAGARVACRTAVEVGADAVLALSFPLVPPGSTRDRTVEAVGVLDAGVPLAVVQGERDPFGGPDDIRAALGERASVFPARGDHSFARHPEDVVAAVTGWLPTLGQ